jgi:hypothetical protein
MSIPVQYPASQVLVGGQPTAAADFEILSGYEVMSATPGYAKDLEDSKNANGSHRCTTLYSKRKTWSMQLEAHADTTVATLCDSDELTDISDAKWNVVSAVPTKTRGPTVVQLEIIQQLEGMA